MVFTVSPAKPRALPDENRLVYIARLNPAGHGLRFPGVASSLPAGDTFVPGAGAARGGGTRHAHLRQCLAFRGASVVGGESPSVAVSVDVRAQEMDPGNHRQTGGRAHHAQPLAGRCGSFRPSVVVCRGRTAREGRCP